MGALSLERIGVVRALINTAPDAAVRQLDAALRSGEVAADQALATVRALVDEEVWDRAVRDAVIGPMLPLFTPRADGFEQTHFPTAALPRLWRVMKEVMPGPVSIALASLSTGEDGANFPPVYDQLCRDAAEALKAKDPVYAPVTVVLEESRPGSAVQFATCLAVTPLARAGVGRLSGWSRQMTSDNAATVRLMFRDAVAVADDGGFFLMEMLQAHQKDAWTILRIVAALSVRSSTHYVSSSEMSVFGERTLTDIERYLNLLRVFDFDNGVQAAEDAAAAIAAAVTEIAGVETALEMDKEPDWARRLINQKGALARMTEGYLKRIGRLIADALPIQPVRSMVGAGLGEPRLTSMPEPRLIERAMAGLTFFNRIRTSSAFGGYGSVRAKVGEEVTHGVDVYMEDILTMCHGGDGPDPVIARAFLEVIANFMELLQDHKSAQIVRRRTSVALGWPES